MKTFSGCKASQREDELAAFIALLQTWGCRSYLEIGARHGDTFHAVMSALPPGSFGIAVDLPGGPWGTHASLPPLKAAVDDLCARGYRATAVLGDSGRIETAREVERLACEWDLRQPEPFDACLIDGDHRYEAVLRDWSLYGRVARLVALHDIDGEGQVQKTSGLPVEVPRAWSAIKGMGLAWHEIVGAERGMGIGVVDMGAAPVSSAFSQCPAGAPA